MMCDFKVDVVFVNGSAAKDTLQNWKRRRKGDSIYYMGPPICRYFIYTDSLKSYILLKYPHFTSKKLRERLSNQFTSYV